MRHENLRRLAKAHKGRGGTPASPHYRDRALLARALLAALDYVEEVPDDRLQGEGPEWRLAVLDREAAP